MSQRTGLYRRLGQVLILFIIGTPLGGCAWWEPRTTPVDRDSFRALPEPRSAAPPAYEGSLFNGANAYSLLFVGRTARHVGDIVTINIVESAAASGQATTATERKSSISGNLEALFGFEKTLQNNGVNPAAAISSDLDMGFDGAGATSRRNTLSATITAIVHEVFPNGNLYIQGVKEVLLNNERQHIVLSGIIRPEDIRPNNSINSNLIADVRIAYSGTGVITEKQRPGWLGRALDVVWPF